MRSKQSARLQNALYNMVANKDRDDDEITLTKQQVVPPDGYLPVTLVLRGDSLMEKAYANPKYKKALNNPKMPLKRRPTINPNLELAADRMFDEIRKRAKLTDNEHVAYAQLRQAAGLASKGPIQIPLADGLADKAYNMLKTQVDELDASKHNAGLFGAPVYVNAQGNGVQNVPVQQQQPIQQQQQQPAPVQQNVNVNLDPAQLRHVIDNADAMLRLQHDMAVDFREHLIRADRRADDLMGKIYDNVKGVAEHTLRRLDNIPELLDTGILEGVQAAWQQFPPVFNNPQFTGQLTLTRDVEFTGPVNLNSLGNANFKGDVHAKQITMNDNEIRSMEGNIGNPIFQVNSDAIAKQLGDRLSISPNVKIALDADVLREAMKGILDEDRAQDMRGVVRQQVQNNPMRLRDFEESKLDGPAMNEIKELLKEIKEQNIAVTRQAFSEDLAKQIDTLVGKKFKHMQIQLDEGGDVINMRAGGRKFTGDQLAQIRDALKQELNDGSMQVQFNQQQQPIGVQIDGARINNAAESMDRLSAAVRDQMAQKDQQNQSLQDFLNNIMEDLKRKEEVVFSLLKKKNKEEKKGQRDEDGDMFYDAGSGDDGDGQPPPTGGAGRQQIGQFRMVEGSSSFKEFEEMKDLVRQMSGVVQTQNTNIAQVSDILKGAIVLSQNKDVYEQAEKLIKTATSVLLAIEAQVKDIAKAPADMRDAVKAQIEIFRADIAKQTTDLTKHGERIIQGGLQNLSEYEQRAITRYSTAATDLLDRASGLIGDIDEQHRRYTADFGVFQQGLLEESGKTFRQYAEETKNNVFKDLHIVVKQDDDNKHEELKEILQSINKNASLNLVSQETLRGAVMRTSAQQVNSINNVGSLVSQTGSDLRQAITAAGTQISNQINVTGNQISNQIDSGFNQLGGQIQSLGNAYQLQQAQFFNFLTNVAHNYMRTENTARLYQLQQQSVQDSKIAQEVEKYGDVESVASYETAATAVNQISNLTKQALDALPQELPDPVLDDKGYDSSSEYSGLMSAIGSITSKKLTVRGVNVSNKSVKNVARLVNSVTAPYSRSLSERTTLPPDLRKAAENKSVLGKIKLEDIKEDQQEEVLSAVDSVVESALNGLQRDLQAYRHGGSMTASLLAETSAALTHGRALSVLIAATAKNPRVKQLAKQVEKILNIKSEILTEPIAILTADATKIPVQEYEAPLAEEYSEFDYDAASLKSFQPNNQFKLRPGYMKGPQSVGANMIQPQKPKKYI